MTSEFSVSTYSTLHYVILVEAYEENLASHVYTVGKEGSILIAFSDND